MINNSSAKRIKTRYLQRMLPAFILIQLFFVGKIIFEQLHQQRKQQAQYIAMQLLQTASLLQDPVWRFNENQIESIVARLAKQPFVDCLRLEHTRNIRPPLSFGDCTHLQNTAQTLTQPVLYQTPTELRQIALLTLSAKQPIQLKTLARDILTSVLITIGVFVVFIAFSLRTFHNLILVPLQAVSAALRHYHKTGERQQVRWQSTDELGEFISEYNQSLELQTLAEQESHNARLAAEQALQQLQKTQQELILSEKMASLGSLVAGVAHEINTPVGSSLTVSTMLADKLSIIQAKVNSGTISRSELLQFLSLTEEACDLLNRNINKAAELVQNFKQVAVDQTSSQRRQFELKKTLEEIIHTLRPQLRNTPHQVVTSLPANLLLDSYPGALGQVITNLVTNALIHAFTAQQQGEIRIFAQALNQNEVVITIEDNGQGMPAHLLKKAFDPFFTTKLGQGGSGLGLHIVYNLVHTVLGGSITLTNPPGKGLVFEIQLPLTAPVAAASEQRTQSPFKSSS